MRVELRLEKDEHEYTVTLETDQSVSTERLIHIANGSLFDLLGHAREI